VAIAIARHGLGPPDQQREDDDEKEDGHETLNAGALPSTDQSVASSQTNRIPGAAPIEETTPDTEIGCQFGRSLRVSSNV
jgi:hypothetical protein